MAVAPVDSSLAREAGRDLVKGAFFGLPLNLGFLFLLVDSLGVGEAIAPLISLSVIAVATYPLTDWWTFRDLPSPSSLRGHVRVFPQYLAGFAGGQVAKYVVYLGVLAVGVQYLLAWVVAAGIGFALSFAVMRNAWLGLGGGR